MSRNKKQTSVIDKKAKEYANRHRFDGDQIELYIECHEGKIKAFKAGAKWREKQIIEKVCNYLEKNATYTHPRNGTETCMINLAMLKEAIKEE